MDMVTWLSGAEAHSVHITHTADVHAFPKTKSGNSTVSLVQMGVKHKFCICPLGLEIHKSTQFLVGLIFSIDLGLGHQVKV